MFWKRDKSENEDFDSARLKMVERQIVSRGVRDERVLSAMRSVPRHLFVPDPQLHDAYRDAPLPIGRGQTISQPYVVASMTEHLDLTPRSRVLEIGTGCGYQTAILAEIAEDVYTVERIEELAKLAQKNLEKIGRTNVHITVRDGSQGWEEHAPYDGIIVTAAARETPPELIRQLAPSGRLVIPVADNFGDYQTLYKYIRQPDGIIRKTALYSVRFVPLLDSTE
jgi:protein-L-isoaspartate(D-aspartate) O-methyltransferase